MLLAKTLKAVHKARLIPRVFFAPQDEARELNEDIFETIYFAACEASCELAAHDGPYETYAGAVKLGPVWKWVKLGSQALWLELMKLSKLRNCHYGEKSFEGFKWKFESLNREKSWE